MGKNIVDIKRYIVFGAGMYGKQAAEYLKIERVACFVDNDINKQGSTLLGKKIISFEQLKEIHKDYSIIIGVDLSKAYSIAEQLEDAGIKNYLVFLEMIKQGCGGNNKKSLDDKKWGEIYNCDKEKGIAEKISRKEFSVWTEEIIKLSHQYSKCLELGCGTGETSVALACQGKEVMAIDYSQEVIELVSKLVNDFNCKENMKVLKRDVTKSLDIEKKYEMVFQCGLLEHFEEKQRIELLRLWKENCSNIMVSIIPNANSIPYNVGKKIMESNNSWEYGLELPQMTMKQEFEKAGYRNIKEYTIGVKKALEFLPVRHYLRKAFETAVKDGLISEEDNYGQGYLLVTIGEV